MDLKALGERLEERRRDIGLPRAELARRIGATENYVWMIERAKRRQNGEPSRPAKELLERWVSALRWGPEQERAVMNAAGYGEVLNRFASTAVFGSAVPLGQETFEDELRRMIADTELPYGKRVEAQREILELARVVLRLKLEGAG